MSVSRVKLQHPDPRAVAAMVGLLQRVTSAKVTIDGKTVGEIGRGLLVLVGIERADNEAQGARLVDRLLGFRVFPDEAGKMNRSVQDIDGGVLLVPNFTLVADTAKGTRASFTPAAPPDVSQRLFAHVVGRAQERHHAVHSGIFGADMQVMLINDGPVTFWLRVS